MCFPLFMPPPKIRYLLLDEPLRPPILLWAGWIQRSWIRRRG